MPARRAGILRSSLTGASGGMTFVIMYSVYGLGFWYGVKLILDSEEAGRQVNCAIKWRSLSYSTAQEEQYSPQTLVIVFFSVLMGGFQIGQSAPYAEALGTARTAAATIYSVIQRRPPIDSLRSDTLKNKYRSVQEL